jgi:hypothetical protein
MRRIKRLLNYLETGERGQIYFLKAPNQWFHSDAGCRPRS